MRATPGTLRTVAILFGEHGIADRTDRLRLCSDHAGRHLTSSAQLTEAEAAALAHRLRALRRGTLPDVVARLVRAEERQAAALAGATVCTPRGKAPTAGDLAQVAAFAAFLKQAGPPPTSLAHDCPVESGTASSCPYGVDQCCMTTGAAEQLSLLPDS